MIVDSSALVAILKDEPEAERYVRALFVARERSISAPNLLETFIVLRKLGPAVTAALPELIRETDISIIAFGEKHVAAADDAHRRFGRGSGHPARLNYGDCIAYATAIVSSRPLLFKGNDFSLTDITPAVT